MALLRSGIQNVGLLAEESMTLVIYILHDLRPGSPILDSQRIIDPTAALIEIIGILI